MRVQVASGLLFLAGFGALAGAEISSTAAAATPDFVTASGDVVYDGNADNPIHGTAENPHPLQMGAMPPPESPRHRQEKAHLMKRMSRKHGAWNTAHPRYRLLEALYGYTKYRERNLAELDRWRSLYSNVGKAQKKVCRPRVAFICQVLLIQPDPREGSRLQKEARRHRTAD